MRPSSVDSLPGVYGVLARLRALVTRVVELQSPSEPAARYPCAVVAVAAAMALHMVLWPLLSSEEPYITFYGAVALVALWCGIGPAIVTAILSGAVAQFFLPPSTYAAPLRGEGQVTRWFLFFGVSAVIIGLARVYRKGMKRLKLAYQTLEAERETFADRVRQRTAELEQAQELRQRLTARLIHTHEEERQRISRELLDNFSQRLALFCIELDALRLEKRSAETPRRLQDLLTQAERLSLDLRDASYGFDHSDLRLGLLLATSSLCGKVSRQHGIDVVLEHEGAFENLSEALSLAFFRVLQEALNNVVLHSGSQRATVGLVADGESLSGWVRDSGRGFDTHRAHEAGGLGLMGMHERMRLVRGSLDVISASGQGTLIRAKAPLARLQLEPNQPVASGNGC